MKALIRGGLFLALGWLAGSSGADEIQWKASAPKKADAGAPAPAPATAGAPAIMVGQPTPLDGVPERAPGSFRPIPNAAGAIIRAQAADDKTVAPLPKLEKFEIIVGDTAQPKPLPKDQSFTPPPPTPIGPPPPNPVFNSLGITSIATDGCCGCGNACSSRFGGCCESMGLGGCDCCPDRGIWWGSAEYLMWWQKAQSVPPLVTASPLGVTPSLGAPTTTVLYNNIPDPMRSGGRFDMGYWFASCPNLGIEVNALFLGRVTSTATFAGNGAYNLGRPFNETSPLFPNGPTAEIFSGVTAGGNTQFGAAAIHTYSQMWGIEGLLRYKWCCGPNYWLDIIGGYRSLSLSEGIDITESTQTIAGPAGVSAQSIEQESFHTRNEFNGAQLGLDGEVRLWNRLFLDGTFKLAMGSVYQIVNIDGATTFLQVPVTPPGNTIQPGALLASPTNTGRFTQTRFGVMPEVGIKIGYDLTDHLRVFVGYDFLYLSNVVRPGDQIDLNVNSNFRPSIFGPGVGGGPSQPAVLLRTTDYWAQGLNFGLLYRY
jgi:hypothetical protein